MYTIPRVAFCGLGMDSFFEAVVCAVSRDDKVDAKERKENLG